MKKFFKGVITLLLTLAMVNPVQSKAAEIPNDKLVLKNKLNLLESSENIIISDPMTYDQLISEYAKDGHMSISEAKKMFGNSNNGITVNASAYSSYRTLRITLTVTSSYKVDLAFYCETSETHSYLGILSILNCMMLRDYNGVSYQYAGDIYYNLENAYTIYYSVSGDFYKNGTTTITVGGQVKVGESGNVTYSISNSSNWYTNISQYGREKFITG